MTHHVGYTLLFEQALQVINPAVSVPYWEYTIECESRLSRALGAMAGSRMLFLSCVVAARSFEHG